MNIINFSLKERDTVEDVSESSLVPLGVLVEMAVDRAHRNIHGVNQALLSAHAVHVLFQGAARTEVGDRRVRNSLTLLSNKDSQCLDVALFLELRLGLILSLLYIPFLSSGVCFQPPLGAAFPDLDVGRVQILSVFIICFGSLIGGELCLVVGLEVPF